MAKGFFAFPYHFDDEYRRILIAACFDLRLEYLFGDDSVGTGALVDKMAAAVESCDYAFFDITGFNPNVMMELGMAYQHKRKIYFMFNEAKHIASPAVRSGEDAVPANIRGQDHFSYSTLPEFDSGIRKALRDALGVGRNSLQDLKIRLNKALLRGPQRIGELTKTIGDVDRDKIEQALFVLRAEREVDCKGVGMGARWELMRGQ
jgi:hypothetical protein